MSGYILRARTVRQSYLNQEFRLLEGYDISVDGGDSVFVPLNRMNEWTAEQELRRLTERRKHLTTSLTEAVALRCDLEQLIAKLKDEIVE